MLISCGFGFEKQSLLRAGLGHKKQHAFLAACWAAAGGCQPRSEAESWSVAEGAEEASTAVLVYAARSCTERVDSGSQPQPIFAPGKAWALQKLREAPPRFRFLTMQSPAGRSSAGRAPGE